MADSKKKSKTILIIEDDPDMLNLVEMTLSSENYSVICCKDGIEGLEKAKKIVPDLAIIDIMLPGMDGIEICRQLALDEKTQKIPTIIITIKGELAIKLSAYMAGAKRYITKPFSREDLIAEVKRTFRQAEISEKEIKTSIDPRG